MASQDRGQPLPKFGEWDVNNPASAEGFTVIFNKARDERKSSSVGSSGSVIKHPTPRTSGSGRKISSSRLKDGGHKKSDSCRFRPKKKWLCCS